MHSSPKRLHGSLNHFCTEFAQMSLLSGPSTPALERSVQSISFPILTPQGSKRNGLRVAVPHSRVEAGPAARTPLHSLFRVAPPWFPHHPTCPQGESWNQPATEIQNLACDLAALETAGSLFCKALREWAGAYMLCLGTTNFELGKLDSPDLI